MPIIGLVAAPFTAMQDDTSVNLDAIAGQAALLARNGVAGAFVCGSTGESMLLTVPERMAVARRWMDTAPAALKVIVHVGHHAPAECRALAAHAQTIGAWGVGAMAPSMFGPDSIEALVRYCADVAAAAPELPFYYYHMPASTHLNFAMADFLEAADGRIPNLAGVKFTHENLMDYGLSRQVAGGRYDILFGRDEILLSALALGAQGAIGSTYNFAAPLYLRIIDAFHRGDMATARQAQFTAMTMIRLLSRTRSFLASAKAIMGMLGVECGPPRRPIPPLSPEERASLRADLERIGFFDYCCTPLVNA